MRSSSSLRRAAETPPSTMRLIASLAAPDDCLMAIILGAGVDPNDNARHAPLTAMAAEFRVPVMFLMNDLSSATGCEAPGSVLLPLNSAPADPFADETIHQAVHDYKRQKIILAGTPSEGAVSFTALSALARGFDVFIVEDSCQSASRRAHWIAMQRLAQAGAVLTTVLQLRAEWRACSEQLAMA